MLFSSRRFPLVILLRSVTPVLLTACSYVRHLLSSGGNYHGLTINSDLITITGLQIFVLAFATLVNIYKKGLISSNYMFLDIAQLFANKRFLC